MRYIYHLNIEMKRLQLRRDSNGDTVLPIGHDYYPLILYTKYEQRNVCLQWYKCIFSRSFALN